MNIFKKIFKKKNKVNIEEILYNPRITDNLTHEQMQRGLKRQYLRYNDPNFASLEVRLRWGGVITAEEKKKYKDVLYKSQLDKNESN